MLAEHIRDESYTRKLAPISPKCLKFVPQKEFCVHRWRISDKRNLAKISKSFIDR